MHSMYIKTREGGKAIEFNERDEARQELIRLLDDGVISQYQYQQYLGYLLNGYETVIIDGYTVFEIAVPALVGDEE